MLTYTPSRVAFIDAGLPDLPVLKAGLPSDMEIHLLDPTQDGLAQMAAVLADCHGLSALHLITHGAPGTLFLGNRALRRADLKAYREEIATTANALVEDGEWLIYGCEVGATREGRQFIGALTEMTGLKVAAATHKVGAAELGGDWALNVGLPATQTLRVAGWAHVLEPTAFTFENEPTNEEYTETQAGVTLTVAWGFWDQDGYIEGDLLQDGHTFYVFSQAIDITSIDWISGADGAEVTFEDFTENSTRTQTFTLTGDARQTLTLTGWEGVTAFRITGGDNEGRGDTIDNIVFTVPEVHKPVINGIGTDDNTNVAANTLAYLDSSDTNQYAYVTGAKQGSYLTIQQPSGTKDGSFVFDASLITFNANSTYSLTGSAVIAGASSAYADLRQDGSFQVGDKVFLLTDAEAAVEIGTVTSLLTNDSDFKITFTREDSHVAGSSADEPGDIGWVLQFINYKAPTGGDRQFSMTVNNDANTVSEAATVTVTAVFVKIVVASFFTNPYLSVFPDSAIPHAFSPSFGLGQTSVPGAWPWLLDTAHREPPVQPRLPLGAAVPV
jgi:hypothetical protein